MTAGKVSAFCSTGLHQCRLSGCSCVCHHQPNFRTLEPADFIQLFSEFCYEGWNSQVFKASPGSTETKEEVIESKRDMFETALRRLCTDTIGNMDQNFIEGMFEVFVAHVNSPDWSYFKFEDRLKRKGLTAEVEQKLREIYA